ncbi:MAG: hemolysin family protein [Bacteroidetes bacterium]|nr:hemolysin family protein [Bacteroidota bacterium]
MAAQIFILIFLIILNGLFAMSEIAIVSSRKSRLEELMRRGNRKAKLVLELAELPNRFLSTIQVGITLIAILIGVLGGSGITDAFDMQLQSLGMTSYTHQIALVVVIFLITFFSIIAGELVPKRMGMTNPESIAMAIARPMFLLSKILTPFVWLLSVTTDFIVKIFGIKRKTDSQVTEEEIRALLEEGTEVGEIQEIEQDIVERVFHLGDQRIGALMTHRNDIVWLNTEDSNDDNLKIITGSSHSIYPLCEKELDNVVGIIYAKDLLIAMLKDPDLELKKYVREVNIVPGDKKAYQVLEKFKETRIHCGVVVDEFGSVEGIITLNDILDGLVGDITDMDEPEVIQRSEDSWLIDGKLAFFEFIHEFEVEDYDPAYAQFHSIAGFVIHQLREIPKTGDSFTWGGYRFEIVDMDRNRIDKILLTKLGS